MKNLLYLIAHLRTFQNEIGMFSSWEIIFHTLEYFISNVASRVKYGSH